MAKVRQDAWSHEDDLLLAETVLRHIREGSTQLNAFEEVGDALNRTSAACGFRWNAEVRNKYIHAIDLAKRQRKERKRAEAKTVKSNITQPMQYISSEQSTVNTDSDYNLEGIIHYLQTMKHQFQDSQQVKHGFNRIKNENNLLHEQVSELENELARTKERLKMVEEDYSSFIQIMERARKMTLLDDQGTMKSPTFRMDKNGNLEQVEQN